MSERSGSNGAPGPGEPGSPGLRYALLVGQGRSGTNHLLRILNESPDTHCRNEPDELDESALNRLSHSRFFVRSEDELERAWDDAVAQAAARIGARDQPYPCPKSWLFPGARAPGRFYVRQRFRLVHRVLSGVRPMDGREMRFPLWMTSASRLRRAFHVFKLNAACGLAAWAVAHRPQARLIHIVRHPAGFARSWLKRWYDRKADEATEASCKRRLLSLIEHDPTWADLVGDVEPKTYAEAELWFWRYSNEHLARAGQDRPNYLRVIYEDLAEHPLELARQVYAFCDQPWTPEIEARVARMSRASTTIAHAWREDLDPDLRAAVERVTEGSPLMEAWGAGAAPRNEP